MKLSLRLLTIICLMLGVLAPALHAQDLGALRDRMSARLSSLDTLKGSGVICENNQGFVEVRENEGEATAVVTAENADRETVYAMIAKQNSVSASQVGRARARQIASGSAAGVWLQSTSGAWYQK